MNMKKPLQLPIVTTPGVLEMCVPKTKQGPAPPRTGFLYVVTLNGVDGSGLGSRVLEFYCSFTQADGSGCIA